MKSELLIPVPETDQKSCVPVSHPVVDTVVMKELPSSIVALLVVRLYVGSVVTDVSLMMKLLEATCWDRSESVNSFIKHVSSPSVKKSLANLCEITTLPEALITHIPSNDPTERSESLIPEIDQ